ncbi:MAG: preprotein translocase subunit SecE [Mycobacterium sp.]
MSDERDSAGATSDGSDADVVEDGGGKTAVVTRPHRPTGKRARRAVAVDDETPEDEDATTDADDDADDDAKSSGKKKVSTTKSSTGKAKKTKKKSSESRNPFLFVWNYLKQVVAELRKVIWPNRKQMVNYTIVVLVFLAFMVTLISLVDMGLARLITLVFGDG